MDMAIGWPTDVEHVAHVTFDRYNWFLGLPEEYENEVPRPTPSARWLLLCLLLLRRSHCPFQGFQYPIKISANFVRMPAMAKTHVLDFIFFFCFWEWVLTVDEFQCLRTSTNVRLIHWIRFLNECLKTFMLALMVLRSPCVFDKGFVCGCDGGCCWECSQNVFGVSAESM